MTNQIARLRCATLSTATAAVACLASSSSAQSQLEWLRAHDGPQSQVDYANACAVDALGNVYAAGGVTTGTTTDIALVKYSRTGVQLWHAYHDIYGGTDSASDCAISPSGDVYVCGYAGLAMSSGYELALLKYSSAGALEWSQTLSISGADSGYLLAFDLSGNVLVVGQAYSVATEHDVLVASYTPSGALNWSTRMDGTAHGWDSVWSIRVLQGGDIALAGRQTNTTTGPDFTVWKLSAAGALRWTASFDAGANGIDNASAIVEASPFKLIACGSGMQPGHSDFNTMVVKLSSATGAPDGSVYFDGPAHLDEGAVAAEIDSHGVVWIAGGEYSLATRYDVVLWRITTTGVLLSTAKWDNNGSAGSELTYRLLLGSAGQAWVCGFANYSLGAQNEDAFVAQFDNSGALDWGATYSSPGTFQDRPVDMALAPGDRIAMAGGTQSGPSGTLDLLAMQIDLSESPQAYCTAKTTSNGCVPSVAFTGMPSASASSGFVVSASELRNQKNGLLFYGVSGALANPYQGGTLCVAPPTARTPVQSSGGSAFGVDCTGSFALDMNAFAAGALGGTPLAALQSAGTTVHCQFWGRDPGSPAGQQSMLTNALRYVVLP